MFFKFIAGVTSSSDLDRMVSEITHGLETPVRDAPAAEFAEKLKEACQRRLNAMHRGRFVASASKDDESFGSKFKAAVQRQLGQRVTRHA